MPVKTRRTAPKPTIRDQDDPSPQEESKMTRLSRVAASAPISGSKKRTNDTTSLEAVTAVAAAKKKKTKSTDHIAASETLDISSYNLRSSARKQSSSAAATVTPANANLRRLTAFATPPSIHTSSTINLADSITIPGVVDIYDPRQPCYSFHRTCSCPSDRSFEHGTDVAFAHMAHYGKAFGEIMKQRETSELARLLARLPQATGSDEDSEENKENASRHSSCNNKSDSDSKSSSSSSSKYTPPPNANARFYPRELSLLHHSSSGKEEDEEEEENGRPKKIFLPRQPDLTVNMRTMLVNWMCEVCQEYKISDDALHLSITLVDRALLMGPTEDEYDDWDGNILFEKPSEFLFVPKSQFQALGCACMLIASKLEDRSTPKIEDLCYISDNSFSESRLRELEEDVCRHLCFRLSSVTPMHFINEYLRASHACLSRCCQFDHAVLRSVVMYLLTLSRLSYDLSLLKPSLLAAASVYLARATLGIREVDAAKHCHVGNPFWTKTLEHYTGYSPEQLKPAVLLLNTYQSEAETSPNHKGVFVAFRSAARRYASLKTALSVDSLGFSNLRCSRDETETGSVTLV